MAANYRELARLAPQIMAEEIGVPFMPAPPSGTGSRALQ